MLWTRSVSPSQIGPARLHVACKRAVVDQGTADGVDAAGLPQRIGAHQHAAAGRGGGPERSRD